MRTASVTSDRKSVRVERRCFRLPTRSVLLSLSSCTKYPQQRVVATQEPFLRKAFVVVAVVERPLQKSVARAPTPSMAQALHNHLAPCVEQGSQRLAVTLGSAHQNATGTSHSFAFVVASTAQPQLVAFVPFPVGGGSEHRPYSHRQLHIRTTGGVLLQQSLQSTPRDTVKPCVLWNNVGVVHCLAGCSRVDGDRTVRGKMASVHHTATATATAAVLQRRRAALLYQQGRVSQEWRPRNSSGVGKTAGRGIVRAPQRSFPLGAIANSVGRAAEHL